ncbi:MAG: DUF1127 domain-containing protein [Neoaquamicrobium sediminum]|uniref:DUF1127 domain-containing protein n=1 Tax=Neoaquamicrobium sediminum TaxID=1849104 RepID=UPI0040371B67
MSDHNNARPRSAFARMIVRGFGRWQRQKAMDQLQALDDRELWDIGISRNDIQRAVEGLFRDK